MTWCRQWHYSAGCSERHEDVRVLQVIHGGYAARRCTRNRPLQASHSFTIRIQRSRWCRWSGLHDGRILPGQLLLRNPRCRDNGHRATVWGPSEADNEHQSPDSQTDELRRGEFRKAVGPTPIGDKSVCISSRRPGCKREE